MSYASNDPGSLPAFRRALSPLRNAPSQHQAETTVPLHIAEGVTSTHDPAVDYQNAPLPGPSQNAPPIGLASIPMVFDAPEIPPSDLVEPSTQAGDFTDFLNNIEERQDALRDARDALVGSRYRLQVQRRELRNTRDKAASQAGATFNRVRNYLLKLNLDLPVEIKAALSEADASRDELGVQELEYEEVERAYNLEEWRYTEKETKFVDDFSGSAPAPSQRAGLFPPAGDDDNILRYTYGPQDIANIVAEADGAIMPSGEIEADPPVHVSDDDSDASEGQSTVSGDPYAPLRREAILLQETFTPKHHAESAHESPQADEPVVIGHYRVGWASTLQYIDNWLLATLRSSELEKGRHKASLTLDDEQDGHWWSLVVQHWSRSAEVTTYHTGETTVSQSGDAPSEPVSSTDIRRLVDPLSTAEFASQPILALDWLPQEREESLERMPFPKRLRHRDLVESTSKRSTSDNGKKHVRFLDDSSSHRSGSIQPTVITRASPGLRSPLFSDAEDEWPHSSSDEEERVLRADEHHSDSSIIWNQQETTPRRKTTSEMRKRLQTTDSSRHAQSLSIQTGPVIDDAVGGRISTSSANFLPQPPGSMIERDYLLSNDEKSNVRGRKHLRRSSGS